MARPGNYRGAVGRPAGAYTQAVRVVRLYRLLRSAWPHGVTFTELRALFGVSERTTRRDIAALRLAGVHLGCEADVVWIDRLVPARGTEEGS